MWQWWKKKCQEKPPSQWRKVGELSELWMFPVKSMGPIRIDDEVNCTILGLKYGDWMYDRVFMVVDQEGKFITARRWPMLVKISINCVGSLLTLNAPEMPAISIDVTTLLKKKPYKTAVWSQDVSAIDCGEDIAKWISRFILKADVGLRLAFYPSDRPTRKFPHKVPPMTDVYTGAYADATSYNMLNEASLMNLNERLEDPVSALNFRPNFVVKGPGAFEEDDWEWVKIGDVMFRKVMPCTRCLLTTVDPQTGEKNSKGEPLETLKSYRQITDPEMRRLIGNSPAFGIHLGLIDAGGKIRRGDDVYVGIS